MNELNLDQLSAISGGKKPILLALSVSVQVQTENGLSANQRAKAKFSSKISDQVTAVRGLSPTPFPWANGEEKDLISCPATSGGGCCFLWAADDCQYEKSRGCSMAAHWINVQRFQR